MNTALLRRGLATVLVTGLAGSATLVAAPALAGVDRHADARGDVVQVTQDGGQQVQAKSKNIDVVREVAAYRAKALSVSTTFREMTKPGAHRSEYYRIRTSEKKAFTVRIEVTRKNPRGRMRLKNRRGDVVACAGATHAVSFADDTVDVRVPGSCLSSPRWLKVGHGSIQESRDHRVLVDDARIDGGFDQRDVRLSPRLNR